MSDSVVELVVHGPPGSPPPVMAQAFRAAVTEAGIDSREWRLLGRGKDPGVDAMTTLLERRGRGDTISTCTPVFIQAPLLRGLPYTHRDLTPIARLVADRYLLVTRADAPFATAREFLDHVTRRPTRTGGYFKGGINHLLALAVADATGGAVEFVLVENEPAIWKALIEGRIEWAVGVPAEVLPFIESATFRVLAALDDNRLKSFPDVPTLGEAGAPITFKLWRGLIGPPGIEAKDQTRWHEIIRAARGTSAWRAYLARNNQVDDPLEGEAFRAFLDEEWCWYERHLGLAGLLPATAWGSIVERTRFERPVQDAD
jgi:putative tricarboxylic transport membrane protein